MENFYEGGIIYDCVHYGDEARDFIKEHEGEFDDEKSWNTNYFLVVFDSKVSKRQMTEEIIEAVKYSFMEEEK